jgi:hypothetical protein
MRLFSNRSYRRSTVSNADFPQIIRYKPFDLCDSVKDETYNPTQGKPGKLRERKSETQGKLGKLGETESETRGRLGKLGEG